MKRGAALLLLLVGGCSTAPIADLLDFFKPGSIGPEKNAPYGGVCVPQPLAPPAGTAPCPVPPPPGPPAAAPVATPPPPPPPVATAPPPVAPTPGPEATEAEERVAPDLGSPVGRPKGGVLFP